MLECERSGGDEGRADDDDGGVAEREHEADGDGALAFLHELAGDVVDGGDVVGVDGVAEAEAVGEQRGAEQERIVAEGDDGPEPGAGIEEEKQDVDADDFVAKIAGSVVEEGEQAGTRRGLAGQFHRKFDDRTGQGSGGQGSVVSYLCWTDVSGIPGPKGGTGGTRGLRDGEHRQKSANATTYKATKMNQPNDLVHPWTVGLSVVPSVSVNPRLISHQIPVTMGGIKIRTKYLLIQRQPCVSNHSVISSDVSAHPRKQNLERVLRRQSTECTFE